MTVQDAIMHIQGLYPPDSKYDDTREIGRDLMDNTIGNKVGYNNWRDLSDTDLVSLAKANLVESGEIEEVKKAKREADETAGILPVGVEVGLPF